MKESWQWKWMSSQWNKAKRNNGGRMKKKINDEIFCEMKISIERRNSK